MAPLKYRIWITACLLSVFAHAASGLDIAVPASNGFTQEWDRQDFRHDLYESLLTDHVDDQGLVDYAALRSDVRLHQYLFRLANTDPAGLADGDARLAFWINAYNALVMQGVLAMLPESERRWPDFRVIDVTLPEVKDKGKAFFRGLRFVVGGRRFSLDEIEHAVLLAEPNWTGRDAANYRAIGPDRPDARIHMALVCAAKGCPKLRRKPFTAQNVSGELDEVAKAFVRDTQRVAFDRVRRVARVSQLLDWYRQDLATMTRRKDLEPVAAFLAAYTDDDDLAASLRESQWRIEFTEYDWNLNIKP